MTGASDVGTRAPWLDDKRESLYSAGGLALRPRYQGPRTTPVGTSNHLHWLSEGDPACHLRGSEHYVVMNILVLVSKALVVLACLTIFVLHSILFFWGPWPSLFYMLAKIHVP